jgi:hypothetical protein
MARFYFDTRDNDQFYPDDQATELEGLDSACSEACTALADYVADHVRTMAPTDCCRVAIEVSDGDHRPLIMAVLTLEVVPLDRSQQP